MAHVYDEIYRIVRKIPKGKVLTYGVISHMIGGRMSAQGVGWALKALGSKKRANEADFDMESVPWQRVVNASGGMSTLKLADIPPGLQQHLLETEGLAFDDEGKIINLDKHLWVEGMRQAMPSQTNPRKKKKAR
ncbi:MAG TPA: MGMT family protein [Drouetiella sp.]|jgi:methylated-DNA-protein-cysteine methyltransferase related protein